MTENAVSHVPEQDVENKLKEKAKNKLVIRSETEYSQEGHQTDVSKTKDAETEAHTETDSVHITAEIYSAEDVPSSYQTEEESAPKHAKVVPEQHGDQYVVLRSSRSKGVNTEEENSTVDACLLLKCIFPPIKLQKRQDVQVKDKKLAHDEGKDYEQLEVSREIKLYRYKPDKATEGRSNMLKCKDSCPNLVINQTSQTREAVTGRTTKPKQQGDNIPIEESHAGNTVNQMVGAISHTKVELGTIEEQEEPEALRSGKMDEETETDETIYVNNAKKYEDAETETEEQKEPLIITEMEDETVDPSAIEKQIIQRTHDAAVDPFTAEEIHEKKFARGTRGPSMYRFETGTIISSQSITWIDSVKRRKYKQSPARTNECFCNSPRTSHSLDCCSKTALPSRSIIQCNAITSVGNCSMSNQTICNRPSDRQISCNRCFKSNSRSYDEGPARGRESDDFWASKNGQSFSSFQEALTNHQLYRINNTQRHWMPETSFENCIRNRSSHNNAGNQYYLNCNRPDNTVERCCWCNHGYSAQNTNLIYCAPSPQMTYHTPHTYYYNCRTWY